MEPSRLVESFLGQYDRPAEIRHAEIVSANAARRERFAERDDRIVDPLKRQLKRPEVHRHAARGANVHVRPHRLLVTPQWFAASAAVQPVQNLPKLKGARIVIAVADAFP